MADEIKIEKGIPAPRGNVGPTTKYPVKAMQVGDSFFIPGMTNGQRTGLITNGKAKGVKLASRTVTENGVTGIRV